MRRKIVWGICVWSLLAVVGGATVWADSEPVVSNVTASQRTDGYSSVPMGMVLIPAGEFLIGDQSDPFDGSTGARPVHAVWVP